MKKGCSRYAGVSVLALLELAGLCATAQRAPVFPQIDLPHPYYYREMYLPQLTTGPNSAAWTPDSRALIYPMAGTLWRQALDSSKAEELTAGEGYDYQPDCSPDGRWVVYVTYLHHAMELWALDLQSMQTHALTSGGAVNVEPRFSPDGRRLAFVSTAYRGHFHIFAGNFRDGELTGVERLTGETRSAVPRFYYSAFDHEISPVWSPDGKELMFVSNRGHIYGTGGFWRMKAEAGAEPHEIHYEETAWKARPDFSPDGKRIVYASYLGGQWHQLWVMPSAGGDAFPISYGDYDNTNARWSPDGTRIAFISNRGGNTSLWVQEVAGGSQTAVVARERRYRRPMGHLRLTVVDSSGRATPARVSITGEDHRAYAPEDAWMQAEDGYVPAGAPFESHYFESLGRVEVTVPTGRVQIEVSRGPSYRVERQSVLCAPDARVAIHLRALQLPAQANTRWVSADLHVHMNYGGTYRNTPAHLLEQEAAEGLNLVEDLVVNKEQRIPDIAYFRTAPDAASTPDHWLLYGQEFHTSYWGHLSLLQLKRNFLLPDYASYGNTAAASLYPDNAAVEDLAHRQRGLAGYAHPFDILVDPVHDPTLRQGQPLDEALELPVDAALGKVDYLEVTGFSDHRLTAAVWYRLLNCGFHLPAGAGSDTMANYASLHGPVGLTRVYAGVSRGGSPATGLLEALRHGRTFVTNGPLLGLTLDGKLPGDEVKVRGAGGTVHFSAWLRSYVPVDSLEIVCNGNVVRKLPLRRDRQSADVAGEIPMARSGWCVLRASSDGPEPPVLDDYVYGTTSPIYVSVAGSGLQAGADAAFFVAWIDRLTQAALASTSWNTNAERDSVLRDLRQTRTVYLDLEKQAVPSEGGMPEITPISRQ